MLHDIQHPLRKIKKALSRTKGDRTSLLSISLSPEGTCKVVYLFVKLEAMFSEV